METRRRILAADDDRITRRLLAVNLERWGYEVVVASDGLEAWEILQEDDSLQIVIVDWSLSAMSGVDICRALRAQAGRPYRYVLLLSSTPQKNDVIEAFEAGADDCLAKPIHVRELELRLTAAVKAVDRRRQPRTQTSMLPTRPSDPLDDDSVVTTVEAATPSDSKLCGSIVGGKYKVVRPIASGGMGTVWEGTHTTLGTRVAIKFIRAEYVEEADSVARFETEARTTARLQSRYAVHVYDYGVTAGGMPYLVMEYLEGRSLTEVIEKEGALAPQEVASVISQAALALEKAHKLGIIHRDVKPDNIMLIPDEEASDGGARQWNVKVVDFGVAKILLEQSLEFEPEATSTEGLRRQTSRGTLLGTPMFMSPEQLMASGVADRHADLWGLAVCAFVAMTGKLPFTAKTMGDLVKQVCLHPPPVPSSVNPATPPGFDEWFARACALTPSERFQSGLEMARELQAACGLVRAVPNSTYPTPPPEASVAPTGLRASIPVLARISEAGSLRASLSMPPAASALLASGSSLRRSSLPPRSRPPSTRPDSVRPMSTRPPQPAGSGLVVGVAVGVMLLLALATLALRAHG